MIATIFCSFMTLIIAAGALFLTLFLFDKKNSFPYNIMSTKWVIILLLSKFLFIFSYHLSSNKFIHINLFKN